MSAFPAERANSSDRHRTCSRRSALIMTWGIYIGYWSSGQLAPFKWTLIFVHGDHDEEDSTTSDNTTDSVHEFTLDETITGRMARVHRTSMPSGVEQSSKIGWCYNQDIDTIIANKDSIDVPEWPEDNDHRAQVWVRDVIDHFSNDGGEDGPTIELLDESEETFDALEALDASCTVSEAESSSRFGF